MVLLYLLYVSLIRFIFSWRVGPIFQKLKKKFKGIENRRWVSKKKNFFLVKSVQKVEIGPNFFKKKVNFSKYRENEITVSPFIHGRVGPIFKMWTDLQFNIDR